MIIQINKEIVNRKNDNSLTNNEPQSSSSSKDEPPTFANGSYDMGAMREDTEEEMGGVVYF